jgi:hypothetical protein
MSARERAIQSNRQLRLIVPSNGRVEWLLAVVGFEDLFTIGRSLEPVLE